MKQKILYLITKSNLGGAQRYVLDLATALPKDEYEVVVACGGNGLLVDRLRDAGVRVIPIRHFTRDISVRREWGAFRELLHLMRIERPDIVHLNSSKAGGLGALVARLSRVRRIVFTAHGWPFYEERNVLWRTLAWFFSYLTALLAHAVIVVSAHDRDGARMPGLSHKITLIHTALPSMTFETRDDARAALFPRDVVDAHADDLWLVSTGELTHNKNLAFAIDALARVRARGHTHLFLTIVGDGELRDHLAALVTLHGLADAVYFTGYIPEARRFLPAFDVFIMPSLKEGFPYGLLEAGALGLPAIVSNVGGMPELVSDGVTGLLIDPRSPESLVGALARIAEDGALRARLGAGLAARVTKTYTLADMVRTTRSIYAENGSRAT